MRSYAIKNGKKFLQRDGEYGSIKGAVLFPTKKEAQEDIEFGNEDNEKVAVVEVAEVK